MHEALWARLLGHESIKLGGVGGFKIAGPKYWERAENRRSLKVKMRGYVKVSYKKRGKILPG